MKKIKCPTCGKTSCEHFIRRFDGRIEWVCEHGVGHTTYDSAVECAERYGEIKKDGSNREAVINAWLIHGCCSCCSKLKNHKLYK